MMGRINLKCNKCKHLGPIADFTNDTCVHCGFGGSHPTLKIEGGSI